VKITNRSKEETPCDGFEPVYGTGFRPLKSYGIHDFLYRRVARQDYELIGARVLWEDT
jgi:hypothetical protein